MNARREFQKNIDRKMKEHADLEVQGREIDLKKAEALSYVRAMQDALRLLPMDNSSDDEPVLKVGSELGKVREAILKVGTPMHINDIVHEIGKPSNAKSRTSLAGSISTYARKGRVFSKTGPNTFFLLELHEASQAPQKGTPTNGTTAHV